MINNYLSIHSIPMINNYLSIHDYYMILYNNRGYPNIIQVYVVIVKEHKRRNTIQI